MCTATERLAITPPSPATIYGFDAEMNRDLNTMEVMATATVKARKCSAKAPPHTRLPRIQLQLRHSRRNTGYRRASRLRGYVQRLPFGRCRILRSPAVLHARPQRTMPRLHLQPYRRPGSHTGRPDYWNLKPMVYKENGEYVDLNRGAFAIGLDAEYPWLTTASEEA